MIKYALYSTGMVPAAKNSVLNHIALYKPRCKPYTFYSEGNPRTDAAENIAVKNNDPQRSAWPLPLYEFIARF